MLKGFLLGCFISILLGGMAFAVYRTNVKTVGAQAAAETSAEATKASPSAEFARMVTLGDTKSMDLLLKKIDINAQGEDGKAPLHVAVTNHRLKSVSYLLAHGADINAPDSNGVTPICFAVAGNDEQILTYLIEHGANVQEHNQSGETLLHKAAMARAKDVIPILVGHGVPINGRTKRTGSTALYYAVVNDDNPSLVELLLNLGADPNIGVPAETPDSTPLHVAAAHDNAGVAALLLAHGAKAAATNRSGFTPLDMARICGSGVVKEMLQEQVTGKAPEP